MERPPAVTAAGALLIIGGVLEAIVGLFLILSIAGAFAVFGVIVLVVGAIRLYAGNRVLGLHENGRQIGIVLAILSGIFNLLSIRRARFTGVISLAIDVFIVVALSQNASFFSE